MAFQVTFQELLRAAGISRASPLAAVLQRCWNFVVEKGFVVALAGLGKTNPADALVRAAHVVAEYDRSCWRLCEVLIGDVMNIERSVLTTLESVSELRQVESMTVRYNEAGAMFLQGLAVVVPAPYGCHVQRMEVVGCLRMVHLGYWVDWPEGQLLTGHPGFPASLSRPL